MMQNINNFYKFASEDETMTNFQRKYGIHNTSAPTHNRRHRKYARLANFSLPVSGIIDEPIELEPTYTTLMTRDYCGNYIYSNGALERILTDNGYIQGDEYYFYIKDYQGNIRVVLNQSNQPVELNSYYPYGALMAATTTEGTQPYKYSAKELDRENGLDLYDSQARHYDPIIPRTTTIDPLCEKFYHLSPYTWCAANPIFNVDKNGMIPTPAEAARIAAHVYGDKKNSILTGGWRVSNRNFGVDLNKKNGLHSAVYERVVNGKVTEYVYATAGTENMKDIIQDALQIKGLSSQYWSSAQNAKHISKILANSELTFVGHSLGGSEAALNSLVTAGEGIGRKAITFNAAGVSTQTMIVNGAKFTNIQKSKELITAIMLSTDPLNGLQNNKLNAIGLYLPDVDGTVQKLKPVDFNSYINGHSIDNILKCYGIKDPGKYSK